jgi:hypothetical protein
MTSDETATYTPHEHVWREIAVQEPPAVCHKIWSYACSVKNCGSYRNLWPDTDEHITLERDDRGRFISRHFASLADTAYNLEKLQEIAQAYGYQLEELPGDTFMSGNPIDKATLN